MSLLAVILIAQTQSPELQVPGTLVASEIQNTLKGSEMVLDSKGSYIRLGGLFNSRRFEFTLPQRKVDLGYLGDITYKIRDVRMLEAKVTAEKQDYVVTAAFESDGVELKGSHSDLGDGGAPDVELDDPVLEVRLRPVITKDGTVTYSDPKVTFKAKVDNTAIPRFKVFSYEIDLVDLCSDYRNQLCKSIAAKVKQFLSEPARKQAFSNLVQETVAEKLKGVGVAYSSLRFSGTDLFVTLKPGGHR